MTDKARLRKIFNAIGNGSLALPKGGISKNWYCYGLHITELVWGRNLCDGWEIEVYYGGLNGKHIGTINIDYNVRKVKLDVN